MSLPSSIVTLDESRQFSSLSHLIISLTARHLPIILMILHVSEREREKGECRHRDRPKNRFAIFPVLQKAGVKQREREKNGVTPLSN